MYMTPYFPMGRQYTLFLFDRPGFKDKGARWISLSKTKKTFFIVIPAGLAG